MKCASPKWNGLTASFDRFNLLDEHSSRFAKNFLVVAARYGIGHPSTGEVDSAFGTFAASGALFACANGGGAWPRLRRGPATYPGWNLFCRGTRVSDALLDPARDAARVRAFFVHPDWARRGIGRSIMVACEQAIVAEGFHTVDIAATLTGEPLYASFGYAVVERFNIDLPDGLKLPCVRMTKKIRE